MSIRVTGTITLLVDGDDVLKSCPQMFRDLDPCFSLESWDSFCTRISKMGVDVIRVDQLEQKAKVDRYIREHLSMLCYELVQGNPEQKPHFSIVSGLMKPLTNNFERATEDAIKQAAIERLANA